MFSCDYLLYCSNGCRGSRGLRGLAQRHFHAWSIGPEKSTYVAQAVDVIRESGLPNETNAMFTNIEGDIDDVLKVIRDATMKLAGQGYRTDVVIRLDIRPGFEGQIHAKQELVNEILSK